jgi:hypothetical protein
MKADILLSTVLAVSTVAYTIINLMIWCESKRTRKQKTTPVIVAYLSRADNQDIALNFKNVGEGLAKNVRIKPIKDYHPFGNWEYSLSSFGIVQNGFNNFPPQYELSYTINSMKRLNEEEAKISIEIEITYENSDKDKFIDVYVLPLNQMTGFIHSDPPETFMEQIPYYLKKISDTLKEKKD